MKYRIKWNATKTGKSGYGTGEYTHEEAKAAAGKSNVADKHAGLKYTVEPVKK